jgi:acyl carrier protein
MERGLNINDIKKLNRDELIEKIIVKVADVTGYPAEVVKPDMDLEAELGIDSIKRVEILDKVSDEMPFIRDMTFESIIGIQNINDVVDYIIKNLK